MAKQFEDFLDEDECCLNCGEFAYSQSKTPGICKSCLFISSKEELLSNNVSRELGML